jgi:phospholipase C
MMRGKAIGGLKMARPSGASILGLALSMPVLGTLVSCCSSQPTLDAVETIVVIYAENRSFDNLYGRFPGAEGLDKASAVASKQVDRDGTILPELPPVWGGLTEAGVVPAINEAHTAHLPNAPFAIDDPKGFNLPLGVRTRDLVHRFYQNQMQINGGANDRFVAYADSGALPMGNYDGSKLKMWDVAQRYVLADNFFMGAFGGSFMNHIYFACACVAFYPNANQSPAAAEISRVDKDGVSLLTMPGSPKSALHGVPHYVNDGLLTPDFYAVNTMQPPYQPSGVGPANGGDRRFADPNSSRVLVPQTKQTIGDLLSAKDISWAYYSGAWQATLEGVKASPNPDFQYHHQPFNYFANFGPDTPARAKHLRDGGVRGAEFIKAIDAGSLPQVSFYKPQGNLTQHAGYTDVQSGDEHVADVVAHLEKSPQWQHMVVIVTYDENGGFWDHVPPPKGDQWGPGTRIPAIIISPFVKRDLHVDKTLYDTSSILRFITRRFDLPMLAGLKERDAKMAAGPNRIGDLTAALDLAAK